MSSDKEGPKSGATTGSRSLIFVKRKDSKGKSLIQTPVEQSIPNSRLGEPHDRKSEAMSDAERLKHQAQQNLKDGQFDSLPIMQQVMYSSLGMNGFESRPTVVKTNQQPRQILNISTAVANNNKQDGGAQHSKLSDNYEIVSQSVKHLPRGSNLAESQQNLNQIQQQSSMRFQQGEYTDRQATTQLLQVHESTGITEPDAEADIVNDQIIQNLEREEIEHQDGGGYVSHRQTKEVYEKIQMPSSQQQFKYPTDAYKQLPAPTKSANTTDRSRRYMSSLLQHSEVQMQEELNVQNIRPINSKPRVQHLIMQALQQQQRKKSSSSAKKRDLKGVVNKQKNCYLGDLGGGSVVYPSDRDAILIGNFDDRAAAYPAPPISINQNFVFTGSNVPRSKSKQEAYGNNKSATSSGLVKNFQTLTFAMNQPSTATSQNQFQLKRKSTQHTRSNVAQQQQLQSGKLSSQSIINQQKLTHRKQFVKVEGQNISNLAIEHAKEQIRKQTIAGVQNKKFRRQLITSEKRQNNIKSLSSTGKSARSSMSGHRRLAGQNTSESSQNERPILSLIDKSYYQQLVQQHERSQRNNISGSVYQNNNQDSNNSLSLQTLTSFHYKEPLTNIHQESYGKFEQYGGNNGLSTSNSAVLISGNNNFLQHQNQYGQEQFYQNNGSSPYKTMGNGQQQNITNSKGIHLEDSMMSNRSGPDGAVGSKTVMVDATQHPDLLQQIMQLREATQQSQSNLSNSFENSMQLPPRMSQTQATENTEESSQMVLHEDKELSIDDEEQQNFEAIDNKILNHRNGPKNQKWKNDSPVKQQRIHYHYPVVIQTADFYKQRKDQHSPDKSESNQFERSAEILEVANKFAQEQLNLAQADSSEVKWLAQASISIQMIKNQLQPQSSNSDPLTTEMPVVSKNTRAKYLQLLKQLIQENE